MKRNVGLIIATLFIALTIVLLNVVSGRAADGGASPFVDKMPSGYRDWKLISVAREEGAIDDIRAILGNEAAVKAFRAGSLRFPDGAIIVRLAWSFVASEDNNRAFGRVQSFVAGAPKNGIQFMVKDSKKYALSGGWGYGQFNSDGAPADEKIVKTCFPCHQSIRERDYVFTHYAP